MRMWMINPKVMCRQHLLGEHLETHMFLSTLNKKSRVSGYIKNNLLEVKSLIKRHDELVKEMKKRGYNHKSKIKKLNKNLNLTKEQLNYRVDKQKSFMDLMNRCNECKKLNLQIIK